MENTVFNLIKKGKIKGFSSSPRMIETVISRVFIFDEDDTVLKFYKKDNDWWNTEMRDISEGAPRISFIRDDFEFNKFLNPKIYISLKVPIISDGIVVLSEPKKDDDDLVIVMRKEDVSSVFTDVLWKGDLSSDEYREIGKSFAKIKLSIPRSFMPEEVPSWHEQARKRIEDVAGWVASEKDFPEKIAKKGMKILWNSIDSKKGHFDSIGKNDLFVSIDCNSENLIYSGKELRFMDAYSPKENWLTQTFDMDIFRVASDIYALSGKDAYESYLSGVKEIAGEHMHDEAHEFYLFYGAMIMGPYFFMLSHKDKRYLPMAEKYLKFIADQINQSKIAAS
ncbi:MAG: hypothetical protein HGB08_00645 [Candidatus Moranbacteria bacterium]|nr:hypothetical protein [Candidatus Moranbacteria bacterium]